MYCLSACNRDLPKVMIPMSYFWHLKSPSNVMKNIVNSISIYSWKKLSLSVNISSKCVVIKIILYFLTS